MRSCDENRLDAAACASGGVVCLWVERIKCPWRIFLGVQDACLVNGEYLSNINCIRLTDLMNVKETYLLLETVIYVNSAPEYFSRQLFF